MNIYKFILNCLFAVLLVACSFENPFKYVSELPSIQYNSAKHVLSFVKNDIYAHDTAYVEIEGIYKKTFPIEDSVSISISKILKEYDELKLAYKLYSNDNRLKIVVSTTRTNDTIFNYVHKEVDIKPISIAKVVYGKCNELCDVNLQRDYKDKIRLWIFKNEITPDTLLVEGMNSLLKQFHYTGHKEYSVSDSTLCIVNSIKGCKFKFNVDLPGKYYYLYAGRGGIRKFIEEKISKGFVDAHYSPNDTFVCEQDGLSGEICLYMIGIDENWDYNIIPCGIVSINDISPNIILPSNNRVGNIFTGINATNRNIYNNRITVPDISSNSNNNRGLIKGTLPIHLKKENIVVNFPIPVNTTFPCVWISYGEFQGHGSTYNIPFKIAKSGDVKTITIGSHILNADKFNRFSETVRLNIPNLHMGDNYIPVTATDIIGNKSQSSLHIKIVPVNNNSRYDYDDLEDRISDIESRLEDWE